MTDYGGSRGKRSSVVRTAIVTSTSQQVIGPSESRVALLITPPVNSNFAVTLSTEPNVVVGGGLTLAMGYPLELTIERHGDAVVRPWYAVLTGPDDSATIGYLEVSE